MPQRTQASGGGEGKVSPWGTSRVQGSPNTSVPHFGLASFNICAQSHLGQVSHKPPVLGVPGDLALKDPGDRLWSHAGVVTLFQKQVLFPQQTLWVRL